MLTHSERGQAPPLRWGLQDRTRLPKDLSSCRPASISRLRSMGRSCAAALKVARSVALYMWSTTGVNISFVIRYIRFEKITLFLLFFSCQKIIIHTYDANPEEEKIKYINEIDQEKSVNQSECSVKNQSCQNDSECGNICYYYNCIDGKCLNMECETSDDCPNNWPCRMTRCMRAYSPCIDETDCDYGEQCWPDGRCMRPPLPPCRDQQDCYPTEVCVHKLDNQQNGRCVPNEDAPTPANATP
jgi:hypothetical protein